MSAKRKHAELTNSNNKRVASAKAGLQSICHSDIPEYLRTGQLFKSFNAEDDEQIDVPNDVLKPNDSVHCIIDLAHLLKTLRYWLVDNIPHSIIYFLLDGDLEMCESVVQDFGEQFPILRSLQVLRQLSLKERMVEAFSLGALEIIRCLHGKGQKLSIQCAVESAGYGHTQCLEYYAQHASPFPEEFENFVAEHGHLDCLKVMHRAGCKLTTHTARAAVINNHVACLRYCCENGAEVTDRVLAVAAEVGSLDCMKYLVEHQGLSWEAEVCDTIAFKGHYECLVYAHEKGCPWSAHIIVRAARGGNVRVLQYIHEHGGQWDVEVTTAGVNYNTPDCLRYALAHGCPYEDSLLSAAAKKGGLACLQVLHEHGVPWGGGLAADEAAAGDHLECLQYAVEHGCRVDDFTMEAAERNGSDRCIEYLMPLVPPETDDFRSVAGAVPAI